MFVDIKIYISNDIVYIWSFNRATGYQTGQMGGIWWVGLVCKDVRSYLCVFVRGDGDSVKGGVGDGVKGGAGDSVRVMGGHVHRMAVETLSGVRWRQFDVRQ